MAETLTDNKGPSLTSDLGENPELKEIEYSINKNIGKRVGVLSKAASHIDEENKLSEYAENPSDFRIPKFSKGFPITDSKNYFNRTQKWVGHVVEVKENEFLARLTDLTNSGTDEIGEFDTDEISEEDKSLIKPGAAFYWSIGYATESGQIKKESIIRFQRLINWDMTDYDQAADRANDLSKKLKWD